MITNTQFVTLFLFVATALAGHKHRRTVNPDIFTNLRLFSEYSAIAYCSANYLQPINGSVVCPATVCPILQTVPSVEIADSFIKVSFFQTTGLIMVDHTNEAIIMSFRGTQDARDWLTDLFFLLDPANDICQGCEAHTGFLTSWRGVRDIVLDAWKSLSVEYPSYKTVATGHSLGGGLANLCAAQIKTNTSDANVYLYTYGAPRVGNDKFAQYIESCVGVNNYRMTHLNDPIPRLPPQWIGFQQPAPEYSIKAPHIPGVLAANYSTLLTPANLVVDPSDILVIQASESSQGDDGYDCMNPAMHSEYLGPISGCLGGDFTDQNFWEGICGDLLICCNALFSGDANG